MGLYKLRTGKDAFLFRVANIAYRHGIGPNTVTALGLCFGIASGVLFMYRQNPFAFASGFLSVFCDVLDGTIARKFHQETSFGKVFDAVSDRTCELAVVLGALGAGIIEPLGVVAIVGSTALFSLRVVSHTYGVETNYVMFGRTERLFFIMLGLILPFTTASTVCFVVAGAFGFASSIQIIVFLSRRRFQMKVNASTKN
jgi:phosphatidylglycerophosphate synthase